jgi:hypothetical protein
MEWDDLALDEAANRFPENIVLFSKQGSCDLGREWFPFFF